MTKDERPDIAQLSQMTRSKRRPWLWLVPVLALAGLAYWALGAGGGEPKLVYETRDIRRDDLLVTVIATGTVQPTTQVELSSELSGTLASVNVDFNDEIIEGQVLAALDDTKLRAAVLNAEAQLVSSRARLTSAKATLTEAEDALTQARSLDQRGLKTRTESVAAQAAFDRAEASVASAAADVTISEANLAAQEADLAKAEIRSPIRGIVLSRTAEKGQIVAASLNAPVLFTLAEDLKRMELRVSVDEADIGRVAVGQQATFTVDAWAGRQFDAVITSLRFAPDEATTDVVSYTAVLSVANDDLLLRPGMTATATIIVAKEEAALLAPVAALRYAPPVTQSGSSSAGRGLIGLIMPAPSAGPGSRGAGRGAAAGADGKSVWILRAGTPERIAISQGATNGSDIVLKSEDLFEGDKVILSQREAR